MEKVTKFFMERRTLFWSVMIGILFMGYISYKKMPKLEDPSVPIKQVAIVAMYPGADAETVEIDVAIPLEDAMRTLPDVHKIKTDVQAGQATVTVEFAKETPTAEIEQHFDIVRRKANDVARTLPQGCMDPVVVDDMMDVYGLFYAFTGDGYSLPELEKYARLLRRELLQVPGVRRVNIGGTIQEVYNIDIEPSQLKRYGLLPTQVTMALQSATKTVDGGSHVTGDSRFTVEITEGVTDADDIRNIQIKSLDGKVVRLGEIAKVERAVAEPSRNKFFVHGDPALTISITLDNSAIVPDVGKAVDKRIAQVEERLPVGMVVEKIFYQPDMVNEAMNGFMLNLLESVLIVVIVLMLSMGWRSGVIIGFGLVLTVALSFPILSMAGTTLQRISLGAFIVAMGMLVDNAVVIMDGILVDRQKGLPRETYLYRIGRNTALPLLGATVIAASTFLPIFLTPGSVGEFAGDLFIVICVSLLVSWVLALVQVPICVSEWMKKGIKPAVDGSTGANQSKVHKVMRRGLEWLLGHKTVSMVTAFVLLIVSCMGMKRVRQIFFPDFAYNQFVIECYFPGENDPAAVENKILALADTAMTVDGVDRVAVSTGGSPARYTFVRPMPTGGDNYAELIIDCADFKTANRVANELRSKLRDVSPEAYLRTRKYNFSISSSHTVEVEFSGPDPEVLRQLSAQAAQVMRDCPYVDRYSVQNNWRPQAPSLQFGFSQYAAGQAGISRSDIANALQAAGDGYTVGVVNEEEHVLPIKLRMRDSSGNRPADLANIPVWDMTGSMANQFHTTLLGNVVDSVSLKYTRDYIYRYNGQRTIQAECDPDPLNIDATPAKVEAAITEAIEAIKLPAGYTMRFVGEGETSKESNELLMGAMPLLLLIVFSVLLMLFNNWKKLFIILVCFPFVICGIMPLLYLTQTPFTFMAILGFMGLIGMMVKNAIVLVDEINRLHTEEQVHEYEAIVQATISRVRPVMLASFTTILGMIPLIGDAMYGSLAVTVVGGLFMGTIVTLLLLPLFYSVLFKVKKPSIK